MEIEFRKFQAHNYVTTSNIMQIANRTEAVMQSVLNASEFGGRFSAAVSYYSHLYGSRFRTLRRDL